MWQLWPCDDPVPHLSSMAPLCDHEGVRGNRPIR